MKKITSLPKLIKTLNTKYSSQNTILATGCFDILHPAHKAFLKAAKEQGDLLLVGLEQDKRIKKLKGKGRPVNNLEKRSKNLTHIKEVDFVFPLPRKFDQPSEHQKLLQLIKPKVLAVSENTPHLKEKNSLIKEIGGKLFIFPWNRKYSTTKILTKKPTLY